MCDTEYLPTDKANHSIGRKRVIIEVGHGLTLSGKDDPGALGPEGASEWAQLVVMASYIRNILEPDFSVLVWDQPIDSPELFHSRHPSEAFVSLHLNAFDKRSQGSEVFVREPITVDSDRLARAVLASCCAFLKLRNRGVRPSPLRILKGAPGAACLVEPFFIDAVASRAELASLVMISAQAIASGIANYLKGVS